MSSDAPFLPRPTAAGWAIVGVAFTALVGSWLVTPLLAPFAGVAGALVLLAPVWSGLIGRGGGLGRVRVDAPTRVTTVAGSPFVLPLQLVDVGGLRRLRDLTVEIRIDDEDRRLGGRRAAARTRVGRAFLRSLDAGRPTEIAPSLRLTRRGRRAQAEVELHATGPLGLVWSRRRVSMPVEILVLPSLGTVRKAPLSVAARPGARQSGRSRRASGDEWRELREWREGESLRRVHWRTSARRGRLVLREFDGQERPDVHLILHPGGERADADGRESAVSLVATLAEHYLRREHGLRVSFPGSETPELPLARGSRALLPLLVRLATWEASAGAAVLPGTGSREIRVVVGADVPSSSDRGAQTVDVLKPEVERVWSRARRFRALPLGLGRSTHRGGEDERVAEVAS